MWQSSRMLGFFLIWAGCTGAEDSLHDSSMTPSSTTDSGEPAGSQVDATAVSVSGSPGDYDFAVTLLSDDVDCTHYADWWEVVGADGSLVFRRILNHSHPDEQPFTRDGGPVEVDADDELWVRGHLNDLGYRGQVLHGSVSGGFSADTPPAGFGDGLDEEPPLPEDCWY